MSNPAQNPDQPTVDAKKKRKKRGMMDVITGQKLLIYSIIAYLCALPFFAISNVFQGGTTLFVVVLAIGFLILLASVITAAISILRVGAVLFPSSRYVYAIGVLLPVPLIGLVLMFIAHTQATKYLKERGVKVGLFGAKR